jgi:hypothetical protein
MIARPRPDLLRGAGHAYTSHRCHQCGRRERGRSVRGGRVVRPRRARVRDRGRGLARSVGSARGVVAPPSRCRRRRACANLRAVVAVGNRRGGPGPRYADGPRRATPRRCGQACRARAGLHRGGDRRARIPRDEPGLRAPELPALVGVATDLVRRPRAA